MSVQPSEDWELVPVRYHSRYIDGAEPAGELVITVLWNRAIDTDVDDPIWIIGKELRIPLNESGPTDFELPATDDPDVTQQNFSYLCTEELAEGGGVTFAFTVPKATLDDPGTKVLLVSTAQVQAPGEEGNLVAINGPNWVIMTQAEYNAMVDPDPNTMYIIIG